MLSIVEEWGDTGRYDKTINEIAHYRISKDDVLVVKVPRAKLNRQYHYDMQKAIGRIVKCGILIVPDDITFEVIKHEPIESLRDAADAICPAASLVAPRNNIPEARAIKEVNTRFGSLPVLDINNRYGEYKYNPETREFVWQELTRPSERIAEKEDENADVWGNRGSRY